MNTEDIRGGMARIFADVFEIDPSAFNENLSSDDLESWDSLGHIRLVMATEDVFGISFALSEIESMKSARQFIDLVSSKI